MAQTDSIDCCYYKTWSSSKLPPQSPTLTNAILIKTHIYSLSISLAKLSPKQSKQLSSHDISSHPFQIGRRTRPQAAGATCMNSSTGIVFPASAAGTSNVTTRACFESSESGFCATEITVCIVVVALGTLVKGSSEATGSCILTSVGSVCVCSCVVVGCSAGWGTWAAGIFSAKRASMWPLVGASLFHSEAVVAGASEGEAPTFPV